MPPPTPPLTPADHATLALVAALLRDDASVLFITGAGVSADSGLPTYRGVGGLYDGRGVDEGLPIEEALSGSMFRRNPDLVWKYLRQIEAACRGALPNRAHEVMAALERRLSRVVVLTQNVDGLHRSAGSEQLIEIHGDLRAIRCPFCSWRGHVADYSGFADTPECSSCGSVLRPRVVLFGEALPRDALDRLERELTRGFDVVLSVGTTSVFPYIADPVWRARQQGDLTVEINPGDTEVSDVVQHRIRAGAAQVLGELGALLGV